MFAPWSVVPVKVTFVRHAFDKFRPSKVKIETSLLDVAPPKVALAET